MNAVRGLRRHRGLVGLLFAVLLVDAIGFGWALPHTVAPHPDDTAKPALEAMQQKFLEPTKYGKVHLLSLAVAYTPYFVWMLASGDFDLSAARSKGEGAGAFADPVAAMQVLLRIARALNVLLHLATMVVLYCIALRLTRHRPSAWSAAAFWGVAPMVAFFARSSNVDVALCFWGALAGLAGLRLMEEPGRARCVLFAVLCILSVCTKEQAAFALAPVCLVVAWRFLAAHPRGLVGVMKDSAVALVVSAGVYAALNDLLWNPGQFQDRLGTWGGNLAWFEQKTAPDHTPLRLFGEALAAFVQVGGPGLALLSVLAALRALARPDRSSWLLAFFAISYGVSVTAYLGYVQPRFFFPCVLFAVLLVARQFAEFCNLAQGRPRFVGQSLLLGGVGLSLAHGLLVAWALTEEPRAPALRWVEQHVAIAINDHPPGDQQSANDQSGNDQSGNDQSGVRQATIYQNENLLPGLRTLGLELHREPDMTRQAFLRQKPALVVVADNFRWMWRADQRAFIDWLERGPPGYTVQHFGPKEEGRATWFLAEGPRSRIWPNVTVLVRDGEVDKAP